MISRAGTGRDGGAPMFSDRAALRFALSARPTASQGEAPASAIENMKIQEEGTRRQRRVWTGPLEHFSKPNPDLENIAYTKYLTGPIRRQQAG